MAKKTRLTRNFTDQNLECPHLLFNYPSKESLKPKFVFPDQNTQKHPEQPSTQTRSSKPISVGDGNHPWGRGSGLWPNLSFICGWSGSGRPCWPNERKCNNYRNLSQFLDLISPCGGSNLVKERARRLLSWLRSVFTIIQRSDAHILTCDHVSAQNFINLTADTA